MRNHRYLLLHSYIQQQSECVKIQIFIYSAAVWTLFDFERHSSVAGQVKWNNGGLFFELLYYYILLNFTELRTWLCKNQMEPVSCRLLDFVFNEIPKITKLFCPTKDPARLLSPGSKIATAWQAPPPKSTSRLSRGTVWLSCSSLYSWAIFVFWLLAIFQLSRNNRTFAACSHKIITSVINVRSVVNKKCYWLGYRFVELLAVPQAAASLETCGDQFCSAAFFCYLRIFYYLRVCSTALIISHNCFYSFSSSLHGWATALEFSAAFVQCFRRSRVISSGLLLPTSLPWYVSPFSNSSLRSRSSFFVQVTIFAAV